MPKQKFNYYKIKGHLPVFQRVMETPFLFDCLCSLEPSVGRVVETIFCNISSIT